MLGPMALRCSLRALFNRSIGLYLEIWLGFIGFRVQGFVEVLYSVVKDLFPRGDRDVRR